MLKSNLLYLIQTLLIAGTIFLVVHRNARALQLQVLIWCCGVIGVMLRYGTEGQLGFYSNDQLLYVAVLRSLTDWRFTEPEMTSLYWWIEYSKIPYPLAALPLSIAGVHAALALKTVSLISLLALSHEILKRFKPVSLMRQLTTLFFSGCALIGSFFSVLALRETMMMYLVFRFTTDKSFVARLVSLSLLALLRSHLAAALIVAELVMIVWKRLRFRVRLGVAEVPAICLVGFSLGTAMFYWTYRGSQGYALLDRIQLPFATGDGLNQVSKVAANFVGLQFLMTHEAFIRLSIQELFILRVIFSDTVMIPLIFSLFCLVLGPQLRERHQFALLAFTIYVSIAINTSFNSFRQNIPLMPLMGMTVLDFLKSRSQFITTPSRHLHRELPPS